MVRAVALGPVPRASRCHGREGGEASTHVHDVDVMFLSSREQALFRWLCVQVQVPWAVRHEGRTDRHQGNESKAELWGSGAYQRAWRRASARCSSGCDRVNVAAAVMVSRATFFEASGVIVR